MDAGRELDALIAEKVMGCRVGLSTAGGPVCECHDGAHTRSAFESALLSYSTDIAAAWQVVERFRASGWQVQVFWDRPDFGAWVVELWDGTGSGEVGIDNHSVGANGDTAPLAICRAALATVATVHS